MEESSVLRLTETHLTETLRKELNDAYRLGFEDAWIWAKGLRKGGTISFEWSSTEMYQYAKKKREYSKEVERLAEKMGIHALYAEVVALRGEGNDPD